VAPFPLLVMKIVPGTNYDKEGFGYSVCSIEYAVNRKSPKHLGCKDGLDLFYIKDQHNEHFLYLKDGTEYVGMIRIDGRRNTRQGYKVGAVYVSTKYRGQGLGTVLYLGAVHQLKKIHSSYNIGSLAIRTWKSVGKYHPLDIYDEEGNKVEYTWTARSKVPTIKDYGRMDKGYDYFTIVAKA
jgi:GNAT superfamily N-acetyltransferase